LRATPLFFKKMTSGKDFEDFVALLLKKRFPDYALLIQHRLDSGLRPDFVLECDEKIIVADAKERQVLTKASIEQICDYIDELNADYGIIFVADFTEISEVVEDYAIINAVEIEYTNWKKPELNFPKVLRHRN
tara:strand:+ start:523 stop:921 length:399 start_codon:yes stop_codon:yes gene_type:complete